MPRGDNPNSRKNLKPFGEKGTEEEQRKIQRAGGKASGRARKEYATLTEALKDQCTPEVKAQLMDVLIKKAKAGNLKALEMVINQMGEKPTEKIEIGQIAPETITTLRDAVSKRREQNGESNS